MARKRIKRRSLYDVAVPRIHGIGLHGLAELPHRNRSDSARWWRSLSTYAKLTVVLLLSAAGLGVAFTLFMVVGSALIH